MRCGSLRGDSAPAPLGAAFAAGRHPASETRYGRTRSPETSDVAHWRQLDGLAHLLDARYRVPGTTWRFGLDSVIGLVPGVGDAASTALSAWILWRGYRLGASKRVLARMAGNVAIDGLIGAVPLAGDVFDAAYKANRRNVEILRRHLNKSAGEN
jgi:Domain of unknown function (DUF4112)